MSEPDVSDLLTVPQAIAILDAVQVAAPRVVEVPLNDADGLILAEAIRADRDYPPFDKSQMDGFAVRAADVAREGAGRVELRVVGEIAAGQVAGRALAAGEAMAIMTGAPLPAGADAIVPVEDTTRSNEAVRIGHSAVAGKFIARRGSDRRGGEVVLEAGMRLNAAALAVSASVGKGVLKCYARPRAVVFTTGDELVPVDQSPGSAEIRDSNGIMIASLLRRMGCDVIDGGIIPDDPQKIREALDHATQTFPITFVSGGMSMGEYDYVPKILGELGVQLRITKLRIKPGKPFVFGQRGDNFVFGLPGNPVSGFVCTVRLASRLVARITGAQQGGRERWIEAALTEPLPANGPREFYQPAILLDDCRVRPLGWKGSADIFTLARANALLVRGENEPAIQAGSRVRVLEI